LHRGDFENRADHNTEAVGGRLEFQLRDFLRVIRDGSRNRPGWHEVEQGVPEA
jgi:hypothetical protein